MFTLCPTTLSLPFLLLLRFHTRVSSSLSRVTLPRAAQLIPEGLALSALLAQARSLHPRRSLDGRIRRRISRKSPRASGPTGRRCLPPTRRVLLNHGQPREEQEQIKGYCIYTEPPSDGSDTCLRCQNAPKGSWRNILARARLDRSSRGVWWIWWGWSR